MASPIQAIARLAFQTFSKQSDKTFPESLMKLKEAVRKLKADDLKFDPSFVQTRMEESNLDEPVPPVTYIPVSENEVFTMGIFVLKSGTRIPLHDHPGMFGILKVIHGSVLIHSYTPVDTDLDIAEASVGASSGNLSPKSKSPSRSPSSLSRSSSSSPSHSPSSPSALLKWGQLFSSVRSFEVIEKPEVEVSFTDDVCIVSPTEGNLHEIRAPNGTAAFLDILAPPYVRHKRDCHYYAIEAQIEVSNSPRRLRVREIRSPHDFWTDSAEYLGPPVERFSTPSANTNEPGLA